MESFLLATSSCNLLLFKRQPATFFSKLPEKGNLLCKIGGFYCGKKFAYHINAADEKEARFLFSVVERAAYERPWLLGLRICKFVTHSDLNWTPLRNQAAIMRRADDTLNITHLDHCSFFLFSQLCPHLSSHWQEKKLMRDPTWSDAFPCGA